MEEISLSSQEIGDIKDESLINIEEKNLFDDKEIQDLNTLKEQKDREEISLNENKNNFLYPSLDDPLFNIKIATKKEFNDTKYEGDIKDAKIESDRLCFAEFELAPHQAFVRNFLSFQTPYNSLLLYHGLGSGKTCSAISVAEEMRDYMKQMGIVQRIIIVASPNVQENFKLQLFDERKLKLVDGLWNIRSCTGNKFLKEINPMNMKGLSKEKVISQVKRIINTYYLFLGYIEFANYIFKKSQVESNITDPKKRESIRKNKLQKNFDNRLIIIDEVHNIRISDDNKQKRVAQELLKLVEGANNIRLLLLSATPMYNSYKEIIWLINLMNINDRRSIIDVKNVFDSDGNFKRDKDGNNIGKELLERKATGYISFVRGENPYLFPFKMWPSLFNPSKTIKQIEYPKYQLNDREIVQEIEHLDLYMAKCGNYQSVVYDYIIKQLSESQEQTQQQLPSFENMESFGYTVLQKPLEALNMTYPYDKFIEYISEEDSNITVDPKLLVGKNGLARIMSYKETLNPPSKTNFQYINTEYGRIFSPDKIGDYSGKIKTIIDNIVNSDGIILVYSQYIDGGLIPVALALEELGITRHGRVPSLFSELPVQPIDSRTYKTRNEMGKDFKPATYVMITGEKSISPDNLADIKALTDVDNINGEKVKVVLLSQAGAEGLDFNNIRQVHVLEPWYNMSRIDQIIGRAVRNCSHKLLIFEKRNVQIFLYGSLLSDIDIEREAADLYVYRLAELKAVKIGKVTRVLKQISVDCLLNINQQNFTEENMNQVVKQILSNKQEIDYKVGDKPFSSTCDYMESCDYKCSPIDSIGDKPILMDTYSESFIMMNSEQIIQRIRQLFKEKHIYSKENLILAINIVREYPLVQINAALDQLVNDKNEFITDMFGRLGRLYNVENLYLFQPIEITNKQISLYDRKVPIEYKRDYIVFSPEKIPIELEQEESIKVIDEESEKQVELPIVPQELGAEIKQFEKEERVVKKTIKSIAIISEMETNYNIALSENIIIRGEEDWYKFCSSVIKKMIKSGVDEELLERFLIEHLLDSLLYSQYLQVLNHIYSNDNLSLFELKLKDFIDTQLLESDNLTAILIQKDEKQSMLVLKGNKWYPAEAEDYQDLKEEIKDIIPKISNLNKIVGFIGPFKNEYMIFKLKFMEKKRHKGARCDQAGKAESIRIMNEILGDIKFTKENTINIPQKELCILQEFTLRLYDEEEKSNKRWFLSPVEASLIDIEKISF